MLSNEYKDIFDRDGCVLVKNVISSQKAKEIRDIVLKLADY